MSKKKNEHTAVGRPRAPGRSLHEETTVILKRERKGPNETTTKTQLGERTAIAAKHKRPTPAPKASEKTWTWKGRASVSTAERDSLAIAGPPPPAPPRKPQEKK